MPKSDLRKGLNPQRLESNRAKFLIEIDPCQLPKSHGQLRRNIIREHAKKNPAVEPAATGHHKKNVAFTKYETY